jgi:hypothetical protein
MIPVVSRSLLFPLGRNLVGGPQVVYNTFQRVRDFFSRLGGSLDLVGQILYTILLNF